MSGFTDSNRPSTLRELVERIIASDDRVKSRRQEGAMLDPSAEGYALALRDMAEDARRILGTEAEGQPAPEISEEEDRAGFHEAAFLAALTGVCANSHMTQDAVDRYKRDREMRPAELLVEAAKTVADFALDAYPFITDDTQLKKGNTQ